MNTTRFTPIILALLLGLTFGLGGCASTPQQAVEPEPVGAQAEQSAPSDALERAPAPAGAPAKESDDMERLD